MNGQDIINFIKKFRLEKKEITPELQIPNNEPTPVSTKRDDKEALFQQNCGALHEMYKAGKIRLTNDERELLEFCHNTDMKKFLKEEFEKNPTPKFED